MVKASELNAILEKCRVDSGGHTHVSMISPMGNFSIYRDSIDSFWNTYQDVMEENKDENKYGIAEMAQDHIPVLADADIRMKAENVNIYDNGHLYSDEMLLSTIRIYQNVLHTVINIDGGQALDTTCFVLEKKIYEQTLGTNTYMKNGFHLHFPNIFVSKVDMKMQINPRVKQLVKDSKVFDDIEVSDHSNIIDDAVGSVPWLLYGSRKSTELDPYKVTRVYDSNCEEISIEDALVDYKLYDIDGEEIDISGNVKYHLPRILSLHPSGREIYETKRELTTPLRNTIRQKHDKIRHTPGSSTLEEIISEATELLSMINPDRADTYETWMKVGWALYNITGGHIDGLDLWNDFSMKSEKYNEAANLCLWDKMEEREGGPKMGTLYYYAELDNKERIEEYRESKRSKQLDNALDGSHYNAACALYSMYGDNIICSSIQNNTWYYFNGHIWEKMDEGYVLSKYISNELAATFGAKIAEFATKAARESDDYRKEVLNAQIKRAQKAQSDCKSHSWKRNVMREAREVFYNKEFEKKLNQNPYIFPFKNGIYDLKTHKLRPGQPDDYVSVHAPIDYKEFPYADDKMLQCEELLSKLFPDEDVRTYFITTSAGKFVGGNLQKTFDIWTGTGDNGKSIIQLLFEKMFGQMAIKMNTQYFTGKKVAAGGANPELFRAAPPVRHVTMEEPDGDEQLNNGELKKLTGNDTFIARDLFQKGSEMREMVPMFELTLICNTLPPIKHGDDATYRRIRVIPFESQFVDDGYPDTLSEQMVAKRFPKDREFSSKLKGLAEPMAFFLLNWRKLHGDSIKIPSKVLVATQKYQQQNDIYRQFSQEHISQDERKQISVTEIYSHFKDWFKEGFPNRPIPNKAEVKSYFVKQWGKPNGTRWKGYYYCSEDLE